MLDLALAVACSLSIGMIFKYAARRGLDRPALLTVNYGVALLTAAVLLAAEGRLGVGAEAWSAPLLGLGVVTGALFIGGFFVYAVATHAAGMSLAMGVMRVSVVIPFLASWVIWGEVPTTGQGAGLAVAAAAFFLIARRPAAAAPEEASHPSAGAAAVLALLFLAGGGVDVLMKTFDEELAAQHSRSAFLLLVFGVAFAIGVVWVALRWKTGVRPGLAVLGWGVVLGVVNYGSAAFILRAIEQLSGPFVFPANNIALVLGAALLGVYVWGERLSRINVAGLALAALALVLLTF